MPIDELKREYNHAQSVPGYFKHSRLWLYVLLTPLVVAVVWSIMRYPMHPGLLGVLLFGYAILIWFKPQFLFFAIPAALPVLDFAPWTGRFFFDEFDLILLVSLIVGVIRLSPKAASHPRDPMFAFVTLFFGLTLIIGVFQTLLPWHMPELNSVNHYYNPLNSLRIAKGVVWAAVLYGLWRRLPENLVRRLFIGGMVTGLVFTLIVVFWERLLFPGLFNFIDVYRVTGPFSQMHIGGSELETYLTLSMPFVIVWMFMQRHRAIGWLGIIILATTSYAMMVTFSRMGYAAYAIALVLVLLASVTSRKGLHVQPRVKRVISSFALVMLTGAIAWPILTAPFAQERLQKAASDWSIRQAHWVDALEIRDPGILTHLLGMGLGRYPNTHYWRSREIHAASYDLGSEQNNSHLRLGSGNFLYLEQFVTIKPRKTYTMSIRVRSDQDTVLKLSLCEKWLLTSARCQFQAVNVKGDDSWHPLNTEWYSEDLGETQNLVKRPIKFSVFNPGASAVIEVDALSLRDPKGVELLRNGHFTQGMDYWFFSVDNDKPWHIWNLPISLIFDLGWIGLLAFSLFVLLGLTRAMRGIWQGDLFLGAIAAAIVGFLVLGSTSTLIDSPRILLLFILLVLIGAQPQASKSARRA